MKKIVKGLCVLAASVLVGGSALVGCGTTEKPPVEVDKVKVTGVTIEIEAYEVGCDFTVEIKAGDKVTIALKTSVTDIKNDVAATDSYVTLSVLDKWGATSQCKVDAPLKKRQ